MSQRLFDLVRRHAEAHSDRYGYGATAIAGLCTLRALQRSDTQFAVAKPLVALLLQGRKRVSSGISSFEYGPGQSLLITADVPTMSQIIEASPAAPYYSLALELDLSLLRDLAAEVPDLTGDGAAVRVEPTDADVADAALRLMRLLERPDSLPILRDGLLREIHYWLLTGRHGAAIRSLANTDSHGARIAQAVAVLRRDFARPIRIEELAGVASMSISAFHQWFRTVTTLSPLQFQKQLRLIEARRKLIADGQSISHAAHAVGYESVPQFTREYSRLFGKTPGQDARLGLLSAH